MFPTLWYMAGVSDYEYFFDESQKKTMSYTCPVCGYNGMDEPPINYAICSSCGTEFGYSDFQRSHEELRHRWIASGANWWSADFPSPSNWSAILQFRNIGYRCTPDDIRAMTRGLVARSNIQYNKSLVQILPTDIASSEPFL